MPWSRETKWRQGCILSPENVVALDLNVNDETCYALAISHDCDIANDDSAEPFVEFITARMISKVDGTFTFGKNPRVLHLSILCEGVPFAFELIASQKHIVLKNCLSLFEPSDNFAVGEREKTILQGWLAARYKRQALPDNLFERIRPVFDYQTKIVKNKVDEIVGYWFNYEPKDIELPPDEPYELWIYIVYSIDDSSSEVEAQQMATQIRDRFDKMINCHRGLVDLRKCEAFSEEEFTLRDMRSTIHFLLDHLSYRTDPPGPTV